MSRLGSAVSRPVQDPVSAILPGRHGSLALCYRANLLRPTGWLGVGAAGGGDTATSAPPVPLPYRCAGTASRRASEHEQATLSPYRSHCFAILTFAILPVHRRHRDISVYRERQRQSEIPCPAHTGPLAVLSPAPCSDPNATTSTAKPHHQPPSSTRSTEIWRASPLLFIGARGKPIDPFAWRLDAQPFLFTNPTTPFLFFPPPPLRPPHPLPFFLPSSSPQLNNSGATDSLAQDLAPPAAILTSQQSPFPTDKLLSPAASPSRRYDPTTSRPQRRTHVAAVSVGISPSPPRGIRFAPPSERDRPDQNLRRDFEDELASSTNQGSSIYQSPENPRHLHRALHISRNTASAILYTLEEGLRQPNNFTPDLVEENAQMADLSGGGRTASVGQGRPSVPGAANSPNIRGPREIMRDRDARTKRKQEEAAKEAAERAHAIEEARLLEEEQQKNAERRAAASAAQAQRGSGGSPGRAPATSGMRPGDERLQEVPLTGVGQGGTRLGGGGPSTSRPKPPAQARPAVPAEASRTRPSQPGPSASGLSAAGPSNDPNLDTASGIPGQPAHSHSTFPHAFERWETLSAHWEGLTSYWIRRLETNMDEKLERDPLHKQLTRQVTDLSAAGANLFHAVVELQRLRASSERKFQRWFFETRSEQERCTEIQNLLQQALDHERAERAKEINEAVETERKKNNHDKQLQELRRELQISKEEARRAWEELGRREQEERDRTASLRDGQPTTIRGVQVVPMMQGVPSRHGSARASGQNNQEAEGLDDAADPFVEQYTDRSTRPTISEPVVQPDPAISSYNPVLSRAEHEHNERVAQNPSRGSALSEEEYEIDPHGQFVRDAQGNKVRYANVVSDDDTDEYDVSLPTAVAARARQDAYIQEYGQPPTSGSEYDPAHNPTVHVQSPPTTSAADYTGGGYGSGPGWEAVPRHHHPTRLSDVLEEDERSRTSASQVSRRND